MLVLPALPAYVAQRIENPRARCPDTHTIARADELGYDVPMPVATARIHLHFDMAWDSIAI